MPVSERHQSSTLQNRHWVFNFLGVSTSSSHYHVLLLLDQPLATRAAGYSDVPSGPRNQVYPTSKEQDGDRSARAPPTKPSGRRGTRFGETSQGSITGSSSQARDVMSLDAPRHPIQRTEEPRSRPTSMYSDRSANDMQIDSLPKGPRAMTQGNQSSVYSQTVAGSPSGPYATVRQPQDVRVRQRALPPHLANGLDGRGTLRERDLPPTTPKGPAAGNVIGGPSYRRTGGVGDLAEPKRQVRYLLSVRLLPVANSQNRTPKILLIDVV